MAGLGKERNHVGSSQFSNGILVLFVGWERTTKNKEKKRRYLQGMHDGKVWMSSGEGGGGEGGGGEGRVK